MSMAANIAWNPATDCNGANSAGPSVVRTFGGAFLEYRSGYPVLYERFHSPCRHRDMDVIVD